MTPHFRIPLIFCLSMLCQGVPRAWEAKQVNWLFLLLNNDGMAACGFLGIFMTRKVQGLFLEVSSDSTKPKKMITEQENNFQKYC